MPGARPCSSGSPGDRQPHSSPVSSPRSPGAPAGSPAPRGTDLWDCPGRCSRSAPGHSRPHPRDPGAGTHGHAGSAGRPLPPATLTGNPPHTRVQAQPAHTHVYTHTPADTPHIHPPHTPAPRTSPLPAAPPCTGSSAHARRPRALPPTDTRDPRTHGQTDRRGHTDTRTHRHTDTLSG